MTVPGLGQYIFVNCKSCFASHNFFAVLFFSFCFLPEQSVLAIKVLYWLLEKERNWEESEVRVDLNVYSCFCLVGFLLFKCRSDQ